MKTKHLIFIFILLLSASVGHAQQIDSTQKKKVVTEKFKISGNCEQCKARIEKAAYKMKGVKDVNWDADSKMLTVIYNSQKVTLSQIKSEIVKAGHDAGDMKATDSSYSSLPDCCKYRVGDEKR